MTHPQDAVEAVARALFHWHGAYLSDERQQEEIDFAKVRVEFGLYATKLIDRIAPMLVAQAVLAEREACAKVADGYARSAERDANEPYGHPANLALGSNRMIYANAISAAIRARGQTPPDGSEAPPATVTP